MSLDQARHRVILVEILRDIFTNPITSGALGFKGGTAAYLFHGLNRFSVDLDFDLLDPSLTDIVFDELKALLLRHGNLKLADKKRYSLIFILDYIDKASGAQNVKLEVNLRNFNSRYEVQQYLGIPMRVMVREDMAANKLVACYERIGKTNRDLYDCYFFLSRHWPINQKIIENRTGKGYSEFLADLLDSVEQMKSRSILAGMGELLDEKQKSWVRNHLKEELLFQIRLLQTK